MASDGNILIFQKLESIEKAQQSMVALLEKIVTQLAAKSPAGPVASYEQLYAAPPVEEGASKSEVLGHSLALGAARPGKDESLAPQPGGWGKAFGRRKT